MKTPLCLCRCARLLAVAVSAVAVLSGQIRAEDAWLTPMRELASSFHQLDMHARSGTLDNIATQAERIARQSQAVTTSTLPVTDQQRPMLDWDFSALHNLGSQLASSARAGERRHVEWYIGQNRNSCVSCHVAFRDLDNLTSFYPAVGITVVADVSVASADGQPLSDPTGSIVFIDGIMRPAGADSDLPRPVISQRNRQFSPAVLPVVRGTTVDFPNDDTILHNMFALSKAQRFDLDVYQPGKTKSVTFNEAGLVRIYCNIHPEMTCSVLVLTNPWFATTDAAGRCVMSGIPDGSFNVRTWRPLGGEAREPVRLSDSGLTRVSLHIQETHRRLAHRNKYGQPYQSRDKYK